MATPPNPGASPPGGDPRSLLEELHGYAAVVLRGWRVVTVGLLVALTAASLHVARFQTTHVASARILVIQQGGRPLVPGAGDPFQGSAGTYDSLATHLMIIRSPAVVERALKISSLKGLSVPTVINGLSVRLPDPSARIVELTYKASSADQAQRVVNGVVASYNEFLKENYQKNTNEVIALIVRARDELNGEIRELQRKYVEYRQKNPGYSADEKGRTFIARRLDQWDQAMNQILARSLQLRSQLELGKRLAREGADPMVITGALNQLSVIGGGSQLGPTGSAKVESMPGPSYAGLAVELADVESRRRTAELLLLHYRRELASAVETRPASGDEVAHAFHEEPEVKALESRLRTAVSRYESTKRLSRSPSDPSLVAYKKRAEALQRDLDLLWEERKRSLSVTLAGKTNADIAEACGKAESDVVALKAREAALKERLGELAVEQLTRLKREHEKAVERHGANHPQAAKIAAQIERFEKARSQPGASVTSEGKADGLLESISLSLESIESMRGDIQKQFEADMAVSKQTEIAQLEENNLRNNLDRQRTLFNSVVDQLKQAQLVSDMGSVSAQTIEPTTVLPEKPRAFPVLATALLGGCGLGIFAAFVADMLDSRVRTVVEIRRLINLPVIGMIPQLPVQSVKGPVGLLSHETPRSALAESYKSTRTNLEFLRRNRRAQILLISSPHPGDGKSTTASNLAITLANTGRRVLLIDGDLRKPSLHSTYDLPRERGLSTVLDDSRPIEEIAQPTVVGNLELLTTGPDVSNPAELLASHRLEEALEQARPAFDTIIIDSSPLLAVTDPSIIAAVADGLILVVRVSSTRRHDIDRTTELLRTLGVPVLGMVINGVTRDQMGYGYGRYGYTNGYGYGYSYGYGQSATAGSTGGGTTVTGVASLGSRVPAPARSGNSPMG